MADISIRPASRGATQLIVNGVDLSHHVFSGSVELVDVSGLVGLRLTLAVGRLDLGDEQDVLIPDQFARVAQRVSSIVDGAE